MLNKQNFQKKKINRMNRILSALSNFNSIYTDVHSYCHKYLSTILSTYIHFYLYNKLMLILNSYFRGCFWMKKKGVCGGGGWEKVYKISRHLMILRPWCLQCTDHFHDTNNLYNSISIICWNFFFIIHSYTRESWPSD